MASETNTPNNTATQAVVLQVPAPGQTVVVNMQPNQVVEVPFDMTEANVTLVGDDLRIEFPGNAVLILTDFATMVDQGVSPLMMFADGSVVAGDVLLTALTAELPETAAGPGGASGGAGEYRDDMGNLIDTVDRLGVQNPDPFAKTVDLGLLDDQPAIPEPVNDPPVATLNTGTIVNGQEDLSADGNLITNVEGGTPDSDPNGDPLTVVNVNGDTSGTVQGTYGTLNWNTDGSYTYTVTNPGPVHALDEGETLTESFPYTISDGALTDSNDLIITIAGVNDPPSISIQATDNIVDESGLPQGTAPSAAAVLAGGTFTLGDIDGLDDLASVTINGTAIPIASLIGSTVNGTNGTLTITAYNAATGVATYSYQLTSPTTDGAGPETDVFTLSVSDGTISSAPATITIEIIDDEPIISARGIEPGSQMVDDSDFTVNNVKDYTDVFAKTFGADGVGATTYSLNVSNSGVDSGIIDTATGNHVFLFLESGAVVGREGADAPSAQGGAVVFTVSVSGGSVTLDQVRAVMHDDPNDPVEEGSSAVILGAPNLITLTATITDGDGDPASSTINLGGALAFADDGPSLSVTGDPTFGDLSVVEASGSAGAQTVTITAPDFTASAVDGYESAVSY
ncbi:MAG: hypothetical protein FIB02_05350, partial [Desulfuromonas sp.]|nr:hypothetical protein [Desulfuromonas sp.]